MKKSIIIMGVVCSVFALGLSSCKKEKKKGCTDSTASNYDSSAEEDDGSCIHPTPSAPQPATYTPTYPGVYGVLVGIKTLSTVDPGYGVPKYTLEMGTAVAAFSNNSGSSFLDAGNVKLNNNSTDYSLTKQSNNSYVYTPSGSNTTGIEFGNNSNYQWIISGSTNWPALTDWNYDGFMSFDETTSGDVTVGSPYTIDFNNLTGPYMISDSILVALHSPNGSKMKVIARNLLTSMSYTFSASETAGLGKGTGYAQVVGLKFNYLTTGGKTYYKINETARTKMITFK